MPPGVSPPPTPPEGKYENRLGLFGEKWFEMMCRVADLATTKAEPDDEGHDYLVNHPVTYEATRWQIKTTESPAFTFNETRLSKSVPVKDLKKLQTATWSDGVALIAGDVEQARSADSGRPVDGQSRP